MPERSRQTSEQVRLTRKELMELVLVAVLLSLGVNILSSVLFGASFSWRTFAFGSALIVLPLAYMAISRSSIPARSVVVEGFVLFDSEKNTIVRIPDYELSERVAGFLSAAFSENKALQKQWLDSPLCKLRFPFDGSESPSVRIMHEVLEYYLLHELSLHLSSYFQELEGENVHFSELSRKDIPQILLANRFLELFSRAMSDREPFLKGRSYHITRDEEDEEAVVWAVGEGGALYDQFEVILPKGSQVSRDETGAILIRTPLLELDLLVEFEGYNTVIPHRFMMHYLGLRDPDRNHTPYKLEFHIHAKWTRRSFLSRKAWEYHGWVESFLDRMEREASEDAFFERIHWPTIEAILQIEDSRKRFK